MKPTGHFRFSHDLLIFVGVVLSVSKSIISCISWECLIDLSQVLKYLGQWHLGFVEQNVGLFVSCQGTSGNPRLLYKGKVDMDTNSAEGTVWV
jgi:hypothetical protein